jgi:hypothetical protein
VNTTFELAMQGSANALEAQPQAPQPEQPPVTAEDDGDGEATEPEQGCEGLLTLTEMLQEQDIQDDEDTEAADEKPFPEDWSRFQHLVLCIPFGPRPGLANHTRYSRRAASPSESDEEVETPEDNLQDLRLDQMFEAEQSLHDSCHTSIQVEGSAA